MVIRLLILSSLVMFGSSYATSQDKTSGQRSSLLLSGESQKKFLLVPMMDKMFLSNVSHEIGKWNGMNFREVRSYFQDYLTDMTALSALENWEMNDMNNYPDSILKNIHVAIGYDYDLVTEHSRLEESEIQKIWSYLQVNNSDITSKRGAYLDKGEIKEFYDDHMRFMNARPDTAWVFGNVLTDFEFDYLLFINELDIHKPKPSDVTYNTQERIVKLHFTLYSEKGKRIYGNAAFSTFSENELDIDKIAHNALFSAINRMIAECSNSISLLKKSK